MGNYPRFFGKDFSNYYPVDIHESIKELDRDIEQLKIDFEFLAIVANQYGEQAQG